MSLKQNLQSMGVRTAQRIAIRKAKSDLKKLYDKHELLLDDVCDKVADFVLLEKEKKHKLMAVMVMHKLITGFEPEEFDMIFEMVKASIDEHKKQL